MFAEPTGHPQVNNVIASLEETGLITMRYFSDKRPELTSNLAVVNYGGHYPAGTSFRSIHHYM